MFCRLVPAGKDVSYEVHKKLAEEYQETKRAWLDAIERSGMGHWMRKPVEVESFYLSEAVESDSESESSGS